MMISNPKVTIVQDGNLVTTKIEKEFFSSVNSYQSQDVKFYNNKLYINFVGVILKDNHLLISMPKHFYSDEELVTQIFNKEDFQLLMDVILKAHKDGVSGLEKEAYNFPLAAFAEIYSYYLRYGLYFEEFHHLRDGYSGKINWRKTIQQVTPLSYQENLIYMPFKVEKKNQYDTFITEAMVYVINDVFNKLNILFDTEFIEYPYNPQAFQNKDYVIHTLYQCRQKIFKDIHLRLVDNLIIYFQSEKENQGQFALKLHHFHTIWEEIVKCQLCNFQGIHDDKMLFEANKCLKRSFVKRKLYPDISEEKHHIEFDHYCVDNENKKRYIFDSKYYKEKKALDYKQLSYYFLTKNIDNMVSNVENTKLVLILPTNRTGEKTKVIFELDSNCNQQDAGLKLYHYYLPIKQAMINYIQI